MKRCVRCGGAALLSVMSDEKVKVGDLVFAVAVPATKCDGCGEVYVSGKVGRRMELEVARNLAERGFFTGEAFRFMGKALGMRAVDLAELLGVAAETVSRWETGKLAMDRCTFAAVAAMVSDRIEGHERTADSLRAAREPHPPQDLHLDLGHGRAA